MALILPLFTTLLKRLLGDSSAHLAAGQYFSSDNFQNVNKTFRTKVPIDSCEIRTNKVTEYKGYQNFSLCGRSF